MAKETKTMTEKVKAKRRVGRPTGRRNKVTAAKAVEDAFYTGMSIAELKQILDYYIENAEAEGLTVKDVLSYVKTEFDLMKFCHDVIEKQSQKDESVEEEVEADLAGTKVAFLLNAV